MTVDQDPWQASSILPEVVEARMNGKPFDELDPNPGGIARIRNAMSHIGLHGVEVADYFTRGDNQRHLTVVTDDGRETNYTFRPDTGAFEKLDTGEETVGDETDD